MAPASPETARLRGPAGETHPQGKGVERHFPAVGGDDFTGRLTPLPATLEGWRCSFSVVCSSVQSSQASS